MRDGDTVTGALGEGGRTVRGAGERQARLPPLAAGDYLLLEEVLGVKTGVREDADPAHRHVVRITRTQQRLVRLLQFVRIIRQHGVPFGGVGAERAFRPLREHLRGRQRFRGFRQLHRNHTFLEQPQSLKDSDLSARVHRRVS